MNPTGSGEGRRSSGPAPRGRPRSVEAEEAILRAALEILDGEGLGGFSIEAVASRAGVGRPSIYRRWPSKLDLAVDAVVQLAPPLKVVASADAVADLRQVLGELLADFTGSAAGRALLALAGDSQAHAVLAHRLDECYLKPRRAIMTDLLQRAADDHRIRADVDLGMLIDLIGGAAIYRWLTTGSPLDRQGARGIVDAVLDLAAPAP